MWDLIKQFLDTGLVEWTGAIVLVLNSLIALCLLIPGEQPEKALQAVVDFLGKFSKK